MTLTEFLTARLAEDEAAARDAHYEGQRWLGEEEGVYTYPADDLVYMADRKRDAAHIVRWQPARVLREVEAKRKILGGVGSENGAHECASMRDTEGNKPSAWPEAMCYGCNEDWPCEMIRTLAAVYRDHPDYDPAWA